jgi:ABC-type thiamine transport system ATPase subunit
MPDLLTHQLQNEWHVVDFHHHFQLEAQVCGSCVHDAAHAVGTAGEDERQPGQLATGNRARGQFRVRGAHQAQFVAE